MSAFELVFIVFFISILSGIIIGLIALAITREVEKAELLGAGGAILGVFIGFFLVCNMFINSAVVVPDQATEQTVSQDSIAIEDLKGMTIDEIQELIED